MPVDLVASAAAVPALATVSAAIASEAKVKAVKKRVKAIVVLRTEFFIGRNLENLEIEVKANAQKSRCCSEQNAAGNGFVVSLID